MHIHICGMSGIEIAEIEAGQENQCSTVCTLKFTGTGGPEDAVTIGEFTKEELVRWLGGALEALSEFIMKGEDHGDQNERSLPGQGG